MNAKDYCLQSPTTLNDVIIIIPASIRLKAKQLAVLRAPCIPPQYFHSLRWPQLRKRPSSAYGEIPYHYHCKSQKLHFNTGKYSVCQLRPHKRFTHCICGLFLGNPLKQVFLRIYLFLLFFFRLGIPHKHQMLPLSLMQLLS